MVPVTARPYFRKVRELRDPVAAQSARIQMDVLSMGMSHDFEVAIEALFGARPQPPA